MRFKHTKTILLIITNLPFSESFCISAIKRFKGFVNKKAYQDQFARLPN